MSVVSFLETYNIKAQKILNMKIKVKKRKGDCSILHFSLYHLNVLGLDTTNNPTKKCTAILKIKIKTKIYRPKYTISPYSFHKYQKRQHFFFFRKMKQTFCVNCLVSNISRFFGRKIINSPNFGVYNVRVFLIN